MAETPTYYKGNELDTTSKEQLTNTIINKLTIQKIDTDVFDNPFDVFKQNQLQAGFQIEEIEVGNLTSEDFDADGTDALKKKKMNFKTLYHKKNREKTMGATVSNKQLRSATLSPAKTAELVQAVVTEMQNSSHIEDFEAFKELLIDIISKKKVMTLCDLNGNSSVDAITKAVQVMATRLKYPNTNFNYSGFKKAFSRPDNLVLIMDATLNARLNVESLATAFNMDKKELVKNIIVIDELPAIEFNAIKTNKGLDIDIGETNPITTHKYSSEGTETASGKVKMLLVDRRCLIVDPVEREITEDINGKGRFINKWLHATDILSYSTLKNAIAFID